jgi:nicotinamide-nucleotide amidase
MIAGGLGLAATSLVAATPACVTGSGGALDRHLRLCPTAVETIASRCATVLPGSRLGLARGRRLACGPLSQGWRRRCPGPLGRGRAAPRAAHADLPGWRHDAAGRRRCDRRAGVGRGQDRRLPAISRVAEQLSPLPLANAAALIVALIQLDPEGRARRAVDLSARRDGESRMSDTLLPEPLVTLARRVVAANRAAGRRISVAESCTAGSWRPRYRDPGLVRGHGGELRHLCRSGEDRPAGRQPGGARTFGAVSVAVGWAMARGALKRSGADVAVAITGIAGRAAAARRSRSGRSCSRRRCAVPIPDEVVADVRHYGDLGRAGVRLQAALCALELLMPGATLDP